MKISIPNVLLFSRLFFAIIIVYITLFPCTNSKIIVLFLMYTGIIADIFDGIIARSLDVSTEIFRLLDTVFDLLFYFSILLFITSINPKEISENLLLICTIIILESSMYFISLARFRKLPSPHAVLSKFWGLYLIIEFTLLIIGVAGTHFKFALVAGIIVHVDRVLIYIFLRHWDHDIPSCYHAFQLRQGKAIKRYKIFNG
jgi:phosphatidylglycerophosphate synthase